MRNVWLVVIIQGNEMSAGFYYRGWILGIHCFRLTSLDVYQWPNGQQLRVQVQQSEFKFNLSGLSMAYSRPLLGAIITLILKP